MSTPTDAAPEDISFTQSFDPATIGPGSASTLRFTIRNNGSTGVTQFAFSNTLPAGITIADGINDRSTCDAGIEIIDADSFVVSAGRLMIGEECLIQFDVVGSTPGNFSNLSGDLTSSEGNSGNSSATLNVDAGRGLSKQFSPAAVTVGSTSRLRITFDNRLNPDTATLTSFSDPLPSGMAVADPPDAANSCGGSFTPSAGASTLTLGDEPLLNAGAICTLEVDLVTTQIGTLVNSTQPASATVNAATLDIGKATAALTVRLEALLLQAMFVEEVVRPGEIATLKFTITNSSRSANATNINLSNDLDATLSGLTAIGLPQSNACGNGSQLSGTGLISLSGGIVAQESSCTFNVRVQVPANAATGDYPNITSAISGAIDGRTVSGAAASDILTIFPKLRLSKSFSENPTRPGSALEVTYTITNTSSQSAAGSIGFYDALERDLPVAVTALPATGFCGPNATVVQASDTPSPGISSIVVTDAELAAGAACTFSVDLLIDAAAANNAYISTSGPVSVIIDGTLNTSQSASAVLNVVAAPILTKRFLDDPVPPGGSVTLEYRLQRPDDATGSATNISFSDDLDAALNGLTAVGLPQSDVCGAGSQLSGSNLLTFSGGSLGLNESCTFRVMLQVPAGAALGSYVSTSSSVNAEVGELATTSQPASDSLIVSVLGTQLQIDDPVLRGTTTTISVTLENFDPSATISNIDFSLDLGSALSEMQAVNTPQNDICGSGSSLSGTSIVTFSDGSLAAGARCTFSFSIQLPEDVESGQYPLLSSGVSADLGGNATTFAPFGDVLDVIEGMRFSKQFGEPLVAAGDTLTLIYTITNELSNIGLSNIGFSDNLDAALSGLTAIGLPQNDVCGTGSQLSGSGAISLSGGNLAAGATCSFSLSLQIPADAAAGTVASTSGSISADLDGITAGISGATAAFTIVDLGLTKSFGGPVGPGLSTSLTYTITNNLIAESVSGLSFNDDLDAALTGLIAEGLPQNDVCGAGSQLSGTSTISLSGATITGAGSCSFNITVRVPPDAAAGSYPSSSSRLRIDDKQFGEPATDSVTVVLPPAFSKNFAATTIVQGAVTTLTLTIDNNAGSLDVGGLELSDNLPAGMQLANPANAATTCNGGVLGADNGGSSLSYNGGSVTAGSSCTVSARISGIAAGELNNIANLGSQFGASGPANATLTVLEVPTIAFDSASYNVAEAAGSVTITVSLNRRETSDVSVGYASSDGTAQAGSDYSGVAGRLTIPANQLSATFSVPILDDARSERDETIILTLSDPSGATLGIANTVVLTIVDDEPVIIYLPILFVELEDNVVLPQTRNSSSNIPARWF
ncbi:MAG: hypothetical protein HC822_11415 [Oscillochloris sp.]|nr:hypothetical protein [Oscillochloris sp.]